MNLKAQSVESVIEAVPAFVTKHTASLNLLVGLAVLFLSCLLPELAFADSSSSSLSTNANTAVNYIKTGVYFILIVAVLGSAVAAAFGRMEWATVGRVLIGCVVAGLATEVVDGLSGLKSSN